jgi:outer membrane receptor protein involved in Fe transport
VKNVSDKSSEYYGYQIAYQPLHTGSVACGWENRWLNLSVHGTAMSSRWANNEHYEGTKLKGFYEMGVAAWKDFKLKNHSLSFRLDVLNLTDSQYEIVSLYPMPGRSWKATLSYEL